MADYLGFLHRHPKMEEKKNLHGHVIVDEDDWNVARKLYKGVPEAAALKLVKEYFGEKSNEDVLAITLFRDWLEGKLKDAKA